MNYEAMSDDEINHEVAKHSFDADWLERHYGKEWMVPDYCNSVEDAWPVIFENGICLASPIKPRDEWIITWTIDGGLWSVNDITYRHKNPLRAAMIVFLMMEDAQK